MSETSSIKGGLHIHSDDRDECPLLITPSSTYPSGKLCIHPQCPAIKTVDMSTEPRFAKTGYLTRWIHENKEFLNERLREHGAIKFQGFGARKPQDFEKVATAYEGELSTAYRGTTPRTLQPGTKAIFSAAEFSSAIPIAQVSY